MQNKPFKLGPLALTTTLTTNILNTGAGARATPPVGFVDTVSYIKLYRIRIVNKTASAATFSLWEGATGANAAGTELIGTGYSIPANSGQDFFGPWLFYSADFLVGGSNTATALTLEASGEIGVS